MCMNTKTTRFFGCTQNTNAPIRELTDVREVEVLSPNLVCEVGVLKF